MFKSTGIWTNRISGPYGPKILAPTVGLVLLALLARGKRTNGRTNIVLYVYRCAGAGVFLDCTQIDDIQFERIKKGLVHLPSSGNQNDTSIRPGVNRFFVLRHIYWCRFNPIPRWLKYSLFHARGGIYAPSRDFALSEPKMHQNLCQFIHIKFEQFVGHRKNPQHFTSKNVVVAAKKKLWREIWGKILPFQNFRFQI